MIIYINFSGKLSNYHHHSSLDYLELADADSKTPAAPARQRQLVLSMSTQLVVPDAMGQGDRNKKGLSL